MRSVILSWLFVWLCVVPVFAEGAITKDPPEMLTYVEPEVARAVIEKHFATMVSNYAKDFTSKLDDAAILKNVVDEYNKMLEQNNGFVSVTGVNQVCYVAFKDLVAKDNDLEKARKIIKDKCFVFAKDLVNTESEPKDDCKYDINKVDGSQVRIKYVDKQDGSGFIRNGGNIAWRFLNPGCLRDSPYKCVVFNTKPNGKFAVFDSPEKGRTAVRWVLENAQVYQGKTVRQAIPIYAPKKENNTQKYIKDLSRQGVNVDKKLSEIDDNEWEKLLDAISRIEGWHGSGDIEEF